MLVVAVRRALSLGCEVTVMTRRADRAAQVLGTLAGSVRFTDGGGRDHTLFHAILAGRVIPGLAEHLVEGCVRLNGQHRRLACPPLRSLGERTNTTGFSLPAMHRWLEAVHGCDGVVMAGGGYLCDEFGGAAASAVATAQAAAAFGKPVVWVSQGLGPMEHAVVREVALEVLAGARAVGLRAADDDALVPEGQGRFTGDDSLALVGDMEAAAGEGAGGRRLGVAVRECASIGGPGVAEAMVLAEDLADRQDYEVCEIESKLPADGPVPDVGWIMRRCAGCAVMLASTYHPALWCAAGGGRVVAVAETRYYRQKFRGLAEMFPEAVRVVGSLGEAEQWLAGALAQPVVGAPVARREELVLAGEKAFTEWVGKLGS